MTRRYRTCGTCRGHRVVGPRRLVKARLRAAFYAYPTVPHWVPRRCKACRGIGFVRIDGKPVDRERVPA